MTQKPTQKNILIIHGPNMNLLGHRKIEASPNITLQTKQKFTQSGKQVRVEAEDCSNK